MTTAVGQRHAARGPVKKHALDPRFQPGNRFRDRPLRQRQLRCGPRCTILRANARDSSLPRTWLHRHP